MVDTIICCCTNRPSDDVDSNKKSTKELLLQIHEKTERNAKILQSLKIIDSGDNTEQYKSQLDGILTLTSKSEGASPGMSLSKGARQEIRNKPDEHTTLDETSMNDISQTKFENMKSSDEEESPEVMTKTSSEFELEVKEDYPSVGTHTDEDKAVSKTEWKYALTNNNTNVYLEMDSPSEVKKSSQDFMIKDTEEVHRHYERKERRQKQEEYQNKILVRKNFLISEYEKQKRALLLQRQTAIKNTHVADRKRLELKTCKAKARKMKESLKERSEEMRFTHNSKIDSYYVRFVEHTYCRCLSVPDSKTKIHYIF